MLVITYLYKKSKGPDAPIYCSMKTLSKSRQLVLTPKYMYIVMYNVHCTKQIHGFFPASDEKDIGQ